MIEFEYLLRNAKICDVTEEYLNNLGKDGWELMHVTENEIIHKYHMLFKRRKELI